MAIHADEALCIAAGRCAAVAPEVFDVDEDGFVVLLDEHPSGGRLESARTAALVCPAKAISLSADGSG